jgi:hypothetical protein
MRYLVFAICVFLPYFWAIAILRIADRINIKIDAEKITPWTGMVLKLSLAFLIISVPTIALGTYNPICIKVMTISGFIWILVPSKLFPADLQGKK